VNQTHNDSKASTHSSKNSTFLKNLSTFQTRTISNSLFFADSNSLFKAGLSFLSAQLFHSSTNI
jgi:hypothetical protein